jgi:hypothetical protein
MAIVQTVTRSMFHDAFRHAGRNRNFTYEALDALFDELERISDDSGEDHDLDVIALCGEYSELTPLEYANEYKDLDGLKQDFAVIAGVDYKMVTEDNPDFLEYISENISEYDSYVVSKLDNGNILVRE